VCEVPGRALADDAPRYVLPAAAPADLAARRAMDLAPLASQAPSLSTLLELLASPNVRSRQPIWRQYDHMNGTNTLVGPGAGDAALLRVKGTTRALALSIDGPGRLGALDPHLAGAAAVIEGALNVACVGATPIGVTDCLNLGSPESPEGYWQLSETVAGVSHACEVLGIPVVSGNVSLYNETPQGPILPSPVVGTVGLLEDRGLAVPMRWRDGDELWLLGSRAFDAHALAGSELAWRRGLHGGRPSLDLAAAGRLVGLLARLASRGLLSGAHDISVGGLAIALARFAIASGVGASIELPADVPGGAAAFGERTGRVVVAIAPIRVAAVHAAAAAAEVEMLRLGSAGGGELVVGGELRATLAALEAAYRTPF
jgi:phosphoribosylformylglycinamidine (FGAM) synthase-like enzyme